MAFGAELLRRALQNMVLLACMAPMAGQAVTFTGGWMDDFPNDQAVVAREAELLFWHGQQLGVGRMMGVVAIGAGAVAEGRMNWFILLDGGLMAVAAKLGNGLCEQALDVGGVSGVAGEALAILHGGVEVLGTGLGTVARLAKPRWLINQRRFPLSRWGVAVEAIPSQKGAVLLVSKHALSSRAVWIVAPEARVGFQRHARVG